MSVDKLVDGTQLDADLTSVANAIRTKGGTSASLAFPAGFVQAIADIPSGGNNLIAELFNGTLSRLDDDSITEMNSQIFRGYNVSSEVVVFLRNFKSLSFGYGFGGSAIKKAVFPGLETMTSAAYFFSGSGITDLDLGPSFNEGTIGLRTNALNGAGSLSVLVLRKTSVVPLQNINCFNNTPFASGKTGGTLFVPSSLVSQYTQATNWSTILGYANNSIQAIEGSQYENYYADGTPIT